ncbi:MAG: ribonuclease HII [Hadesarchaea archaeon]|nr:MAG: ribonuclease HII [Hadesarchaea archaeon]HDI12811.1 ribonuclease HII [Hadesarchaea archaeon]
MIAGCDEAGRGPVLGNMVLCGVKFDQRVLDELRAAGIKDSKLITPKKREMLVRVITEKASGVEIVEFSPSEIDEFRLVKKINLNELEARTFAQIIDRLKPRLVYLDSPDPNPELFEQRIRKYIKSKPQLVVENFADRKYVAVAAASIVAKVRRDQRIAELRQHYGDFGSGYPADPRTISFLERWVREHGKLPDFTRKSWWTAQRIESETRQRKKSGE